MRYITRKIIKIKILLVLVVQMVFLDGSAVHNSDIAMLQRELLCLQAFAGVSRKDVLSRAHKDIDKEDEELVQELLVVLGSFYKNAFEASAMYLSGYQDMIFDKLMLDLSKDLLLVGKILVAYIPKTMNNPQLSWRAKTKKSVYALGLFSAIYLVVKELRKHKRQVVLVSSK